MSLKTLMPFFNNPPPRYYRIMAVLCGLSIIPLLYIMVLCLWGHEYWPIAFFGLWMFFVIVAVRNLLRSARFKESERAKQEPTPDA
jgi:hypothetical protein